MSMNARVFFPTVNSCAETLKAHSSVHVNVDIDFNRMKRHVKVRIERSHILNNMDEWMCNTPQKLLQFR